MAIDNGGRDHAGKKQLENSGRGFFFLQLLSSFCCFSFPM
jgi:hypothetical protein